MRRALAVSLLAALAAAAPADARRYTAELPRNGVLRLKVEDGQVRASLRVRLRCDSAPFRRRYVERGLRGDVERRRFTIGFSAHGDTGAGGGSSETLDITGRVRADRVVGRIAYERASFGNDVIDYRCRFGPRRYRALRGQ